MAERSTIASAEHTTSGVGVRFGNVPGNKQPIPSLIASTIDSDKCYTTEQPEESSKSTSTSPFYDDPDLVQRHELPDGLYDNVSGAADRAALVESGGVGLGQAFLTDLWAAIDVDNLRCCHCDSQIDVHRGLARTFCLRSQCVTEGQLYSCSPVIEVPTLDDQLIIYHRHMACLFESTEYVAISHVWHRDAANAQCNKQNSTV